MGLTVEETDIAMVMVNGEVFAFQDRCPHMESSLSDGEIDGYEIYCPLHQSGFDVRTGRVCNLPARAPLKVYAVRTDGASIWVDLEATASATEPQ